jgi:hypothetical protein
VADGRCGSDGAAEYQRNYIRPLVDQSRDIVLARCSLPSPYDLDFASGAAPTRLGDGGGGAQRRQHSSWSSLSFVCAAVVFIVNRAPLFALTFVLMSTPFVSLSSAAAATEAQLQQPREEVERSATAGGDSVGRKSKGWRRGGQRRQRASLSPLSVASNIRSVIRAS